MKLTLLTFLPYIVSWCWRSFEQSSPCAGLPGFDAASLPTVCSRSWLPLSPICTRIWSLWKGVREGTNCARSEWEMGSLDHHGERRGINMNDSDLVEHVRASGCSTDRSDHQKVRRALDEDDYGRVGWRGGGWLCCTKRKWGALESATGSCTCQDQLQSSCTRRVTTFCCAPLPSRSL